MVKSEISKRKLECLRVTEQNDVCAEFDSRRLLSLTSAERSFPIFMLSLGLKCARSSLIFLLSKVV